jgi:hypothetical protein
LQSFDTDSHNEEIYPNESPAQRGNAGNGREISLSWRTGIANS